MKQKYASEGNQSHRERVRQLGFDPDHLTSAEQQELLELEARLAAVHGSSSRKPALAQR